MGYPSKLTICLSLFLGVVAFGQACGKGLEARKAAFAISASSNSPGSGATPTPSPLNSIPELKSWNDSFPAPVYASDCLTNPSYNMCLSYKDPVSTAGSAFSPAFTITSATSAQEAKTFVYGLKVPTSTMANDNFILDPDGYNLVKATASSDWKYSYRGDTNHYVGQIHAWYWLNRERSYLLARTGVFYASTSVALKKLRIYPAEDVQDNAYFDPSTYSLYIGYSDINQKDASGNTVKADLSLDIATIAHELGHANYYVANKSSIDSDTVTKDCKPNDPNTSICCPTKNGCAGAMHEGVADFHAKILFPDKDGSILNYFFNSTDGQETRNVDVIETYGVTADTLFNLSPSSPGEVHNLGSVYASIWYGVWKRAKAQGNEKDVETLFMDHLTGVGGSDTFLTAFTTIKAMAKQFFPASADTIIASFKTEYARLGYTVN